MKGRAVVSMLALAGMVGAAPVLRSGATGLTPVDLRVNYLDTPLGIDDLTPTFSWKLAAPEGTRGAAASCSLAVKEEGALEAVLSAIEAAQ